MRKDVDGLMLSVQDVFEAVHTLSSQTDEQFRRLDERFVTKDDLQEFKQEIMTHVDWFATHHRTIDTKITSLRNASFRHEERITVLEKKICP